MPHSFHSQQLGRLPGYTNVLKACSAALHWSKALDLFGELLQQKQRPDVMGCLAETGRLGVGWGWVCQIWCSFFPWICSVDAVFLWQFHAIPWGWKMLDGQYLIVLVQSIMITGGSGFGFRVRGGWRTWRWPWPVLQRGMAQWPNAINYHQYRNGGFVISV